MSKPEDMQATSEGNSPDPVRSLERLVRLAFQFGCLICACAEAAQRELGLAPNLGASKWLSGRLHESADAAKWKEINQQQPVVTSKRWTRISSIEVDQPISMEDYPGFHLWSCRIRKDGSYEVILVSDETVEPRPKPESSATEGSL